MQEYGIAFMDKFDTVVLTTVCVQDLYVYRIRFNSLSTAANSLAINRFVQFNNARTLLMIIDDKKQFIIETFMIL